MSTGAAVFPYLWLSLLKAAFIISILLWFGYTCYVAYIHWRYSHIPGPDIENFYFGNLRQVRNYHRQGIYVHKLFLKWAIEFGPVYRLHLLHNPMVIVTGKEGVKELLTKSKYRKCKLVYSRLFKVCGQRFLGHGMVTNTNHYTWLERHALIQPVFHKKHLGTFMDQFNETASLWMEKLRPLADGKTIFNMGDYISRVTLDVIGKAGFNFDVGALEDTNSPFPGAVWQVLEGISLQYRDPLMMLRPSTWEFRSRVRKAARFLRYQGRKLLEESRKNNPCRNVNFLSQLLCYLDRDINMEDVLDDFVTLFVAGQETTANALTFLLHEVGRHPHVYKRLVEEVDRVVGSDTVITQEHAAQLSYMGQVFKETLRRYPPASATAREPPCDAEIEGYVIPKGTFTTVPFYVIQNLPQNFPNPEQFIPERFDPDQPKPLYSYSPFSMGRRACVGQQFAQIEAKVLMSKFLQSYSFSLDPTHDLDIQELSTLRPRDGCRMTILPRSPS